MYCNTVEEYLSELAPTPKIPIWYWMISQFVHLYRIFFIHDLCGFGIVVFEISFPPGNVTRKI